MAAPAKAVPMEMPAMAPSDSSFALRYLVVWEVGPLPLAVVVKMVVEMLPAVVVSGGNVEMPLLTSQLTAVSGIWPPRATLVLQCGKSV